MGQTAVFADVQGAPPLGAPHSHSRPPLITKPRRWSPEDYGPEEALAAWMSLFSKECREIPSDSQWAARPFRLKLEQHLLGSVRCNFVESNWQQISRTREPIDNSKRHDFVLYQTRTGMARFRVPQGTVTVRPGECVLVNTGEPFELDSQQPITAVILVFPGHWLARWLPSPERCCPLFTHTDGWSMALCSAVGALHPDTIVSLALPGVALAENIAGLLALASGPTSQRRPPLVELLRTTLRDCLHEPAVCASRLAEQHEISLRTLHYAFSRAGTTFMRELVRMRLDRARNMLSDADLTWIDIGEVSERCGFSDPSHFARRFRRTFGLTPLEFRRKNLG
jgi:AraC family transcriptional regulator, positive regulator of tynA and feaB